MKARSSSKGRTLALASIAVFVVVVPSAITSLSVESTPWMDVAVYSPAPRSGDATPPAGVVPRPKPLRLAQLGETPDWKANGQCDSVLRFHVDLDLFAPLGNGGANAADWFRDFATLDGSRLAEWQAARKREVTMTSSRGTVRALPGDDPLLLEAEPWVDQARCNFYPHVWQVEGDATRIPNMLMAVQLGRAWAGRGDAQESPKAAARDYRRVVRLGRLLLQDDVTVTQRLAALSILRLGVECLHAHAHEQRDALTMVAAATLLGDIRSIQQQTVAHLAPVEDVFRSGRSSFVGDSVVPNDVSLRKVLTLARRSADRCLRLEAMSALHAVAEQGAGSQAEEARAALETLSFDGDALVAGGARWHLRNPLMLNAHARLAQSR